MYQIAASTIEARRAERTHMYLIAILYHGIDSSPVRLRNLSRQGALIEASNLPNAGSIITLRRGTLEAKGRVVRASDDRIGVEFFSPVSVQSWLPVKGSPAQRSVDQLAVAMASSNPFVDLAEPPQRDRISSAMEISAELKSLQSELTTLGDSLAQDCILVATHPEIQFLDQATQRIAKLIDAVDELNED